jgi:CRP/FNR family transcriptional regulator, dissimilatory nitrate respiration regulator
MADMDWLPEAVHRTGSERTLKAGETLFRAGTRTAGLYQVVRGRVRLARVNRKGRETVLYVATAGEILAEASLFSSTYHCDAIATTNAVVRLFPKAAVLAALARDADAALAFMAMLARQLMTLRMRLEQRNIRSARDRLRHYLSMNVGADGRTVLLTGTLKDLAGELGLTHEALYRALAEMAKRGEIKRGKGMIRLPARSPL